MKKIILVLFTLFLLAGCCGKKKCCPKRPAMRWCAKNCQIKTCDPCKYDTVKECDDPCYSCTNEGCKKCFHCGECLTCENEHRRLGGCPELPVHTRRSNFFTCNRPETNLLTRNY